MDIAVITGIISAVSVANYFFYKLYTIRLNQIEKRIEKLETYLYNHIEELDKKVDKLSERVARLEALVSKHNKNK